MPINQNPEQIARDNIDKQLIACGWVIQNKTQINLAANIGVAVREYLTNVGPADYVLFVNQKAVGVIEAKREEEAHKISVHEGQVASSLEYRVSKVEAVIRIYLIPSSKSTFTKTLSSDFSNSTPFKSGIPFEKRK